MDKRLHQVDHKFPYNIHVWNNWFFPSRNGPYPTLFWPFYQIEHNIQLAMAGLKDVDRWDILKGKKKKINKWLGIFVQSPCLFCLWLILMYPSIIEFSDGPAGLLVFCLSLPPDTWPMGSCWVLFCWWRMYCWLGSRMHLLWGMTGKEKAAREVPQHPLGQLVGLARTRPGQA